MRYQSFSGRCWDFKLVSTLITAGIFAFSNCCVSAQMIKQDNTLGAENSVVTTTVIDGKPINQIDGGAIRGTNLFHSFEQFSVLKGSTAYFNNAANIQNIISRVTGKPISNIDGIIKANGTANLFLINPNGIIFGPNALLNIGGSFVASTASSVNFADGIKFSTIEPQSIPLLKVSVPIGLQFGATPGSISNESQASSNNTFQLRVKPGKSLALVGGDIVLNEKNLVAIAGKIELGSVAGNSLVSLNSTDQGWSLGYENVKNFQDIRLTNSAIYEVSYENRVAGNLTITTRRLILKDGAQVIVDNSNSVSDSVPQLTINASDSVELSGSNPNDDSTTGLFTGTDGVGNAGNIIINTRRLNMQEGAEISTESYGVFDGNGVFIPATGKAGNITLNVQDLLLMRQGSQISTNAQTSSSSVDGGNITINAPSGFLVTVPSENNDITANSFSNSGGKITINAKSTFGFVPRTRADLVRLLKTEDPNELNPSYQPTSDITAFSQQSPPLNGTIQINSPDVDPTNGLVQLPVDVVDASHQIVPDCNSGGKTGRSSFITIGRGGLIADPTQLLMADDAVIANWITLSPESNNTADGIQKRAVVHKQRNPEQKLHKVNSVNEPTEIVEAQGWVIDTNGNVVLVAHVPTATPHNSSLTNTSCLSQVLETSRK